jgi:hypothetical protein
VVPEAAVEVISLGHPTRQQEVVAEGILNGLGMSLPLVLVASPKVVGMAAVFTIFGLDRHILADQ